MDAHRTDNMRGWGHNGAVSAPEPPDGRPARAGEIELSYCVVNTSQRELLVRGLDAIARERDGLPFASEVLVLDNGSRDGSAQAAREHPAVSETIALEQRRGKALTTPSCCAARAGATRCCSTRTPSCVPGPRSRCGAPCRRTPGRRARAPACCAPTGREQASAWRFPSPLTALAGALLLHRRLIVQSTGQATREVDWCQSAALLVRRGAAAQVGYLDPDFFVYSDEVDFALRLRRAGWRSVYVPAACAVHHEQLSSDAVPERRIVELARNRDLYMRKHHSARRGRGRALAHRLELLAARARGAGAARALRAALLAPRHRHPAPAARRGPARGGR